MTGVGRPKLLDYTTDRQEMLYRSNEIFKWLGDGKLKVSVDKMFDLDKVGRRLVSCSSCSYSPPSGSRGPPVPRGWQEHGQGFVEDLRCRLCRRLRELSMKRNERVDMVMIEEVK
eukprot:761648-Hanusia_phi.AAC.2